VRLALAFVRLLPLTTHSVWKPLKGPLMDWPLALCSAETVNYDNDLIACDLVNRSSYSENMQVYYNANHEWWYLSGQLTSELLVFRQADTSQKRVTGQCYADPP
jgi:hypothetical protein